jgi:hypothetical protein
VPVVEPERTTPVMREEDTNATLSRGMPPSVTLGAPQKLVPSIVIVVPVRPLLGVKLVMRGATKKWVVSPQIIPSLHRVNVPSVAPAGTVTVRCVPGSSMLIDGQGVPLRETEVMPSKSWPMRTTDSPTPALDGEMLVTTGGMRMLNASLVASAVLPTASVAVMRKCAVETRRSGATFHTNVCELPDGEVMSASSVGKVTPWSVDSVIRNDETASLSDPVKAIVNGRPAATIVLELGDVIETTGG